MFKKATMIIFTSFLISSPFKVFPEPAGESPVAREVKGEVWIEEDGTSKTLKEGDLIPWGSVILTGEKGEIKISTPDGSELKLYSSSKLILDESLIEKRPRVMLSFGVLLNKVSKFFSNIVSFRTYSPSSVCGVRGTTYYVEAGIDGSSLVYVEEGSVVIEGLTLKRGDSVEVALTDRDKKVIKGKLKKYLPGRWYRKHRKVNPEVIKRLLSNAEKKKGKIEKILEEYKKMSPEELAKSEIDVSRQLAFLGLLTSKPWKNRIGKGEFSKAKRLLKAYFKSSGKIRNMPVRVKKRIEKNLRIKNIPEELLKRWLSLSKKEKKEILEKLKKWKNLSREQRETIVKNYIKFNRLPPEKRKRIIENYKKFKKMSPEQRKRILELYKKWEKLSPEQRERLKRKFREMKKQRGIRKHLRR